MNFNIITRCVRPQYLSDVRKSIELAWENLGIDTRYCNIAWHVIFDLSAVSSLETVLLKQLKDHLPFNRIKTYLLDGAPGDMGHTLINQVMNGIFLEEWIYVLDDDNQMHPEFFVEILNIHLKNPQKEGFIFSQYVGGKDFSKLEIREAKPENVKVQGIDMAQFILKMSLVKNHRFIPGTYVADGIFIEKLYQESPEKFHFIDKVLCNYNSLSSTNENFTLPRILVMDSSPDLKSLKIFDFESDALLVKSSTNENAKEDISSFNPDCIITTGESYEKYPALSSLSYDFRQRWIHTDLESQLAGERAYLCAMNFILNKDVSDLISIFTPIHNTKQKLLRTYQSILNQTHTNWEWVLVNDSTDRITLSIAENIAKKDPRVRIYDFKEKTRGIIGEAKYRACALSQGSYLIELDHDDYLLPHALEKMLSAFLEFPDAGFVYSDCAEIDENYNSLTYGEGFSFGYGSYREETHSGITFKVANTANINPITIRHIVGVPNHFRAWKRETYFQAGGHNRRLSIADDYELIIRTFLLTKFVKIPLCCYLQFYHDSNSQNATRSDIQRRVRSIAQFYNQKIRDRFIELGKEDWAYNESGIPWNSVSRTGEEENFVNYVAKI